MTNQIDQSDVEFAEVSAYGRFSEMASQKWDDREGVRKRTAATYHFLYDVAWNSTCGAKGSRVES